ncbi:MAG TPA: DUF2520 domain-containing protein [Candidatus Saccharimonadales bacterium]|nr:DUF2520 domain-containing protein [Candidatus Saccharimonadales bacterium]
MAKRPSTKRHHITLIGAGNLATAIGPALRSAGYNIDAVAGRALPASRKRATALARKLGARLQRLDEVQPLSGILWLCHTDDALSETAALLARRSGWRGKIVLHSSGALSSDVLAPLQRAGAHAASVHPMMTFVAGVTPRLHGVPFGIEGDRAAVAAARRIVRDLGAAPFAVKKETKVLYHALGSFSSPLLVATLATAERVGRAAGLSHHQVRKIIGPILQQTLDNYLEKGAAASFSGPVRRGDVSTIRRHWKDLQSVPGAAEVYRALVQSALLELPAKNKKELKGLWQDLK